MFVDLVFCIVNDASLKWFVDSAENVNRDSVNNEAVDKHL